MFWWIVLSALVTFLVSYILMRIGALASIAMWITFPIEWLAGGKNSKSAMGLHGTIAIVISSFCNSFAGLFFGLLILKDHVPIGFYWLLAGIIGIEMLLTILTLNEIPKARLPLYSMTLPNILGPIIAVFVGYFIAYA